MRNSVILFDTQQTKTNVVNVELLQVLIVEIIATVTAEYQCHEVTLLNTT